MNRAARVFRRLAPRTLRGRLSLVALTTAALLMTVLTVVFNAVMDQHLQHQADDELSNRAAAVATTVDTSGRRVRVLETANDRLLDTNVWIYAGTHLLEKPPSASDRSALTQAAVRLAAQSEHACTTAQAHGRSPVRLCSHRLRGRHTSATVVAALNLAPYRSSADTLLLASLMLDAVMLGCTYVLTRLSVGRALRPVRTMTDQATQWSATGSDERFGTEDHPVELARLGASLDQLLDRIGTVLRHEQQLTAELSHELRTPLTRIIMELDWWRTRPRTDAETRAAHEAIAEAAQSMRTICDTLLNEARESALNPSTPPGATDVVPVLDRLLENLQAPDAVKTSVETEAPVLEAGVAPALLERIVSPLLANAARYARSRVTVSAQRVSGAVRIEIVDDGPGVPEAFVADLFQPGRRADYGDGHDGAGLGLPLARRLARAVSGEVSYDPRHAPGAKFTVSLPAG
ncbi:sensor histidine kinase [Streptomyces sp. NBC_00557]|uniref:sensor histidine kinase n=1 Tax=Streptomyces sp. NBC_00557 TaxID=2975776 RepID=UPI002E818AF6|nr:HAMP domain-containing sensor histidine kinase [Streptomyces sp. NBC_00557]WUC39266.1 HAMP domain-containing histidine kinase [Streptomyces sp. NBC_00557]